MTKIEHQPTFVVKPYFMENPSINIEELIKEAPNYTINELAERYSVDYGTIYRTLSRYKVEAAKAYEPITKEVLETVFEEPRTLQDAATILHTTPSTVSYAIRKHNFISGRKPTVKSRFVGERSFKVLAHLLRNPEESLASVGRQFNCTREYVRQVKQCALNEGIIKQENAAYEQ